MPMGLMSEQFNRVADGARKSRLGLIVRDKKNGCIYRFHYNKGDPTLWAKVTDTKGVQFIQEVIDVSKVGETKSYKETVKERIRADHPDKSDEELEFEAGLLAEGRKAMEALVAKGIDAEVAFKLVKSAMNERIVSEEDLKGVIADNLPDKAPDNADWGNA